METFSSLKDFVFNPNFEKQRIKALRKINYKDIDSPFVETIKRINALSYCFTLQCCYGHFLYTDQKNEHNLEPIPKSADIEEIEYRIAYLAFCIQDNVIGRELFNKLKKLTKIDSKNIQFACAEWFWDQHVNTFILQVEPERYKMLDKVTLDYEEALQIEIIRNQFFNTFKTTIKNINTIKVQ